LFGYVCVPQDAEPEDVLFTNFARILCVLFVHCNSLAETQFAMHNTSQVVDSLGGRNYVHAQINSTDMKKQYGTPAAMVSASLRALLMRVRAAGIIADMDERNLWSDFDDAQHCTQAVRAYRTIYPPKL
jgi:hypothetical protein